MLVLKTAEQMEAKEVALKAGKMGEKRAEQMGEKAVALKVGQRAGKKEMLQAQ